MGCRFGGCAEGGHGLGRRLRRQHVLQQRAWHVTPLLGPLRTRPLRAQLNKLAAKLQELDAARAALEADRAALQARALGLDAEKVALEGQLLSAEAVQRKLKEELAAVELRAQVHRRPDVLSQLMVGENRDRGRGC